MTLSGGGGVSLATLVVSDIPFGAKLSDDLGNSFTATAGSGNQQVDVHTWDWPNLKITAPNDTNFSLTVTATEQDTAGISQPGIGTEAVTVNPLAPTVAPVAVTGKGVGSPITLALGIVVNSEAGSNGDGPQTNSLHSVTISDIPSGATLSNTNHDPLSISGGSITFDGAELAAGVLNGLAITPANSTNFSLNIAATEQDAEGNLSTTTNGTEAVTVNPLGPPPPTVSPVAVTGVEESAIKLDLGVTVNGSGNTLASLVVGAIPIGATLSDDLGNHFTAMPGLGNQQTDVGGWDFANLTITPPTEFEGSFNLSVTATEQNAALIQSTATGNEAVTVSPIAEPGTASAPATLALNENATNVAVGTVTVGPLAEDSNDTVSALLTVKDGTLHVANGSLPADVTVTGDSSGTLTVAGGAADVNTVLTSLTYTPITEYEGSDTLNVTVTSMDGGNTSATLGTASTAITVSPIAEPGTASAPATLALNENATNVAVGTVTVGPLAEDSNDTVSALLTVKDGTLHVANGSLPADVTVTGDSSGTLTVAGGAADVNTVLTSLTYTPITEYEGSDTLNVTVTSMDGGNTSATLGTASTAITVSPIAEPGTASAPATLALNENATNVAVGTVTVGPLAEDSNDTVSALLTVKDGTLHVANGSLPADVTVTGDSSGTLTVAGGAADVNTVLTSLTYTPITEYEGSDTLNVTVTSMDGGNTSATLGTASTAITVSPIAEPGTASAPATLALNENATNVAVGTVTVGPLAEDSNDTVSALLTVKDGTLHVANGSLPADVTVTGDSSGTLTVAGGAADVNTVLTSLTYTPITEYEGSDTLNVTVTSMDGGNTSATLGTASTAITVSPIAEPGTASAPATLALNENATNVAVGTVTVGPLAEDSNDTVSALLTVKDGTLHVANGSLPADVTVTGDSSGTLTVAGGAADVNTVLTSLTYTPITEYEGSDTLNVTVTSMDGGNTSATLGTASTAITVSPIAEPGTASAPATLALNENATNVAVGTVTVGPLAEDSNDTVSALLTVKDGTLHVANGSLPADVTVTGDSSGTLTVAGGAADVNTVLTSLTYTPITEYEGSDTLNVTVTSMDGGNTSATLGTASTAITVSPIAEPGTASAPATLALNENATNVAVGTVTVGPLAEDSNDTVSALLTVKDGTLHVANGSLPADVTVTGDSSGTLTVAGGAADVNTVLTSLTYTPITEYEGSDTLNVTVTSMDGGNTSATLGTASTAITVSPIAEPGTASAPATLALNENATNVAVGTVTVGPLAEDSNDTVSALLTVKDGTLHVANGSLPADVTVTGDSSGTLTVAGGAADVNTVLTSLTYTPITEYEGSDTLNVTVTSMDGGNTSATLGTASTAITVNGVADVPIVTATASAGTTTENSAILLSGLSVQPGDASANDAADSFTATLYVADGVLTVVNGTGGDTFQASSVTVGGGDGDGSAQELTITGSLSNVQAALDHVQYTPTSNFAGTDTVTFTALSTEEASVGGKASSDATPVTASITVTGTAVPVIGVPGAQTLDVNETTAITGISLSESGSTPGETFVLTLTDTNGILAANPSPTVTSTDSGHGLILFGTLSQIYNDLGTVTDTDPTAGADTITVRAVDGLGHVATTQTIAVTAYPQTPPPEPPTLNLGGTTATVNAGHTVALPSISVTPVDAGDTLTVTIAELPMGATLTDSADHRVFSGSSFTLTAAEAESTLTLNDGSNGANFSLLVTANNTTIGEAASSPSQSIAVTVKKGPGGVAGSAINLAVTNPPAASNGPVAVSVSGVPSDWRLSDGTYLGNGTWAVETDNLSALTVMTTLAYAGATLLNVTEAWTNADGTTGHSSFSDNVEAYAPGSPIFAWSGDDTLTGAGANDVFVFSQSIGNDVIYNFNAVSDKIDLVGLANIASFDDIRSHISTDANGDAIIAIGPGENITLHGINAESLTAANFAVNESPVVENNNVMAVGDGATLPLGGTIDNMGTIALNSTGDPTELQLVGDGVTLEGGGQVRLSGDSANIIDGTSPADVLTNVDNTISGVGWIGSGDGNLTLINDAHGTIEANVTGGALILDTGNDIKNDGLLEAANGGVLKVEDSVHGGTATIAGGTVEFGAAADVAVTFDNGPSGTAYGKLVLDDPSQFTGSISGFAGTDSTSSDSIDVAGLNFGAGHFSDTYNAATGVLTLSDGTNTDSLTFIGFNNNASSFEFGSDTAGTGTVIYDPPPDSNQPTPFPPGLSSDDQITIGANGRAIYSLDSSVAVTDAASQQSASMVTNGSVVVGGPGNDHFVFAPGIGAETIDNLNPQQDTIELDHFASAQNMQELQSIITTDLHGDAVINLGYHDSVTLSGVTEAQLQHAIQAGHVLLH